jgi:hypothetical protein
VNRYPRWGEPAWGCISLHESGSWSCLYVSEEKAAPFIAPGTSRDVDIWQRPPEFGEGRRHGFAVIVPWTELRVWPEVEEGAIEFAPHPGHGHWAIIEIVFGAAGTRPRLYSMRGTRSAALSWWTAPK